MIELVSTKCCGVREINNLSHASGPSQAIAALKEYLLNANRPFVIFTGVTERVIIDHASGRSDDYGQAFCDYIREHKLGVVTASSKLRNWTRNVMRVWVWEPDYDKLRAWDDKQVP